MNVLKLFIAIYKKIVDLATKIAKLVMEAEFPIARHAMSVLPYKMEHVFAHLNNILMLNLIHVKNVMTYVLHVT